MEGLPQGNGTAPPGCGCFLEGWCFGIIVRMKHRWLPALAFLVLTCSCTPGDERPAGGSPSRAANAASPLVKSAATPSQDRQTDDFGLPLQIHLDVPEVPAEIRNPAPPIHEEAKRP